MISFLPKKDVHLVSQRFASFLFKGCHDLGLPDRGYLVRRDELPCDGVALPEVREDLLGGEGCSMDVSVRGGGSGSSRGEVCGGGGGRMEMRGSSFWE